MADLASVNIRVGLKLEQLQRGLQKAERELLRSGRQMSALGRDLTTSLTLPFAAASAAAVKFASDFEASTTKIETLVGVSGQELETLKTTIAGLSGPLGKTQRELSDAALFITGAGLRGEEALRALEASAKASAIGLGEQTEIAKVAGAAVAAYGEANIDSAGAVDKLLAIVREGNAEASELAPKLGSVLPVAAALGVSFDEVGASVATFSKLGVNASTAVDGLRSLLGNILKPSEQAAKELANVGLSMQDVRDSIQKNGLAQTLIDLEKRFDGNSEALARIFGDVQGLTAVLATAGAQGEDYVKVLGNIQNANGEVDKAFEKVSETADFKLKKALVELQNVSIQFGGVLLPIVTDLLGAVTPLISAFARLPKPVQEVSVVAGGLLASAGPLVSIFGNLKTVAGTVGIAFKSLSGGIALGVDAFNSTRAVIAATGGSLNSLSGVLPAVTAAWREFNTVVKASIIGAAVAAVIGLVAVVQSLNDEVTTAEKSQQRLNKAVADTNVEIEKEKILTNQQFEALKSSNIGNDEKKRILEDLKSKYPGYLDQLSVEKSSLQDITTAQRNVNDELVKTVALKQKNIEKEIVAGELARKLQRIRELQEGAEISLGEATKINTGEMVLFGGRAGAVINKLQSETKVLRDELSKIDDIFSKTFGTPEIKRTGRFGASAFNTGTPEPTPPASTPPIVSAFVNIKKAPAKPDDFKGFGDNFQYIADAANESSLGVEALDQSITQLSISQDYQNKVAATATLAWYDQVEALKTMGENLAANEEKVRAFNAALTGIVESGIESTLAGVGEAIGNIFAGASGQANSLALVLEPILGMMEQLGKLAIASGVAVQGIKAALQTLNPVAAIAGGIALIALSKLVRSQLSGIKPKPFADGGLVYGPTYALIGEGPGTSSSNPEVVAPLDKLKGMLQGGGGGVVTVEGTIRGRDIHITNRRESERIKRTTGR